MNSLAARHDLKRWWFIIGASLVLLKLWLVAAQPIVAIGGAAFDDRLYLDLAHYILNGEWLGHYTQRTLMKGPMFSLWIAFTFLLGIPLPLGGHLLYLAGCGLIVRALNPYLRSRGFAFAIFMLLWWNPMTYEMPVLGRVLRQGLYTPLTLIFFAALIALETRRSARVGLRLAWGALLGFSGAALYLTREETIWVYPSAIFLIVGAAGSSWHAGEKLKPLIAPLAMATLCAGVGLGTVCTLNYTHYGWFGTVEFRAPQFLEAYGALQRVIPNQDLSYVPVTRDAREKIYRVSPAFAELRPYLEGDTGLFWAGAAPFLTGKPPAAREIAGGWFMWALRDAVIEAGYKQNAAAALAFYARLGEEVNRACDDGRLKALPRHDSMIPPWRHGYPTRLEKTLPPYVHFFIFFHQFSALPPNSAGDAGLLELFSDVTRWHASPSPEAPQLNLPDHIRVDGWRISVLERLGRFLCRLDSKLVIAALIGWGLWLVRTVYRRRGSYLLVLSFAVLGGAAAVVLINLLVDILSFPNRSTGALAEAYPLILLFVGIVGIEAMAVLRRNQRSAETIESRP